MNNYTAMPNVQIRAAISTDLPRLMGLDHSCSSDYVWQLDVRKDAGQVTAFLREVRLPRTVRVDYPRDPYALADEWKHKSNLLTALEDDQPVGYVQFYEQVSSGSVWVTDLVVMPAARRRGIGSALLLAAQNWAVERNHRKVFAETLAKNYPAVCLMQKNAYEFCGYNDIYYATHDVALFFGRSIR